MYLKIHNEGWVFLLSILILSFIFLPFFPILSLFLLILSFFIYYFFRDPIRTIPKENVIISPADGMITSIGESHPPKEINIKGKFLKISIFLSIFDVHVNRIPISGVIKKINYISGNFFNAQLDKSSDKNERNIIVIENNMNEFIIVSQIAGLIARRIICNIDINQKVYKGERFGIIKFGSRVDIYLPENYNLLVSAGQKVIGGETILSNPNNIKNINKSERI